MSKCRRLEHRESCHSSQHPHACPLNCPQFTPRQPPGQVPLALCFMFSRLVAPASLCTRPGCLSLYCCPLLQIPEAKEQVNPTAATNTVLEDLLCALVLPETTQRHGPSFEMSDNTASHRPMCHLAPALSSPAGSAVLPSFSTQRSCGLHKVPGWQWQTHTPGGKWHSHTRDQASISQPQTFHRWGQESLCLGAKGCAATSLASTHLASCSPPPVTPKNVSQYH